MNTVSDLGLLKFDFLALRNLSVINEAEKLIREKKPDFSSEELDLTDRAAYAMISSGSTEGIFQLESEGLRRIDTGQVSPLRTGGIPCCRRNSG